MVSRDSSAVWEYGKIHQDLEVKMKLKYDELMASKPIDPEAFEKKDIIIDIFQRKVLGNFKTRSSTQGTVVVIKQKT